MTQKGIAKKLAPALAVLLVACPMKSSIWILPESTVSRLEFGISDKRNGTSPVRWGVLTVRECQSSVSDTVVWAIQEQAELKKKDWPTRVVYGESLEGFKNLEGPKPLLPGCYEATVIGTGMVRFLVKSDGSIEERPAGEFGKPYPLE